MNDYEMLRVIDFLERTRAPLRKMLPMADDEPVWNAVTFLIKAHIKGQTVTQTALTQVMGLPYATGLRLVGRLVDAGHVVRTPRSKTGKSFALHPSDALISTFSGYARQMKALLAETLGLRVSEAEEDEYYFGGTPLGSTIIPPLRLAQLRAQEQFELRFLLNDDNYFTSMRNMWADFRNNLAFRRNFDLVSLPDLHAQALENGARDVSRYDVITLNMPWLGEFAEKGLVRPISENVRRTGVNPLDFHPVIWSTGHWRGTEYGVPIYCTIEILAARKDLFATAGIDFPGTFSEVIAAAREFHDPRKGMTGIVWDGARGMPIASTFMFFLGACGSPILSLLQTRQGFTLDGIEAEALIPLVDSDAGRAVLAAELLGVAEESFERTLAYLREREQFGAKIGTFQALQHRAAHLFCEIELVRSVVLRTLQALDAQEPTASSLVCLAKGKASDVARIATNEAVQMHGGIGMTDEFDIGFFMKRARAAAETFGDGYFQVDRFAQLAGY